MILSTRTKRKGFGRNGNYSILSKQKKNGTEKILALVNDQKSETLTSDTHQHRNADDLELNYFIHAYTFIAGSLLIW